MQNSYKKERNTLTKRKISLKYERLCKRRTTAVQNHLDTDRYAAVLLCDIV